MRGFRPFCRSSFRFKPSALPRHLLYFPIIPRWAVALFAAPSFASSPAPSPAKRFTFLSFLAGFHPFNRSCLSSLPSAFTRQWPYLNCHSSRGFRPFCRSIFRLKSRSLTRQWPYLNCHSERAFALLPLRLSPQAQRLRPPPASLPLSFRAIGEESLEDRLAPSAPRRTGQAPIPFTPVYPLPLASL